MAAPSLKGAFGLAARGAGSAKRTATNAFRAISGKGGGKKAAKPVQRPPAMKR